MTVADPSGSEAAAPRGRRWRGFWDRRSRHDPPHGPWLCDEHRSTDGLLVYAVGDVHGRADLLVPLLERISSDAAPPHVSKRIVFMGDYVDRGPQSREVVDLVTRLTEKGDAVALLGNHDDLLLQFLADAEVGPAWCGHGGEETLLSYGVTPPPAGAAPARWASAQAEFAKAIPDAHWRFLARAKLCWRAGSYFFCHAGVRPDIPLDGQSRRDLLWIREPFLQDHRPLEKVIVHGHTPSVAVHVDERRIGVDTGAYATGVLAAARLFNAEISIITAEVGGRGKDAASGLAVRLHTRDATGAVTTWEPRVSPESSSARPS